MGLDPGTRLGPYEIAALIGAGGMGEVYRATDTKLKRQVAIKVLPSSLANDPGRLARLQREAQMLASFNHPHIAAIYGVEDSTPVKALVMELVEGPTLADRIAPGPLAVDEAMRIARQIADALDAAHEQGVIHRDLKPANIKVKSDGTVKVLDFGVRRRAELGGRSQTTSALIPFRGGGMDRRDFLLTLATPLALAPIPAAVQSANSIARKGRIKQGVTRGVFARGASLDDCCREAARLGIKGFDLIGPPDWPLLRKYGLVPSMYPLGPGGTIADALNRKENHAKLEASLRAAIDECAANQVPNIITFSGNRRGMADQEGADNCVEFLNRVKAHAEDKGVTIQIELLNSKVNHRDYMFDHMSWGVDVVKRVNSPRVKILYDIYHAQIMDGDIVRAIRDNIALIGHFHTGGNPGRNDIDETQELNYHYVMEQIAALGFTGFVSHEYSPKMGSDPIAVLRKAIEICDV